MAKWRAVLFCSKSVNDISGREQLSRCFFVLLGAMPRNNENAGVSSDKLQFVAGFRHRLFS